jgi:hypothetical protein
MAGFHETRTRVQKKWRKLESWKSEIYALHKGVNGFILQCLYLLRDLGEVICGRNCVCVSSGYEPLEDRWKTYFYLKAQIKFCPNFLQFPSDLDGVWYRRFSCIAVGNLTYYSTIFGPLVSFAILRPFFIICIIFFFRFSHIQFSLYENLRVTSILLC